MAEFRYKGFVSYSWSDAEWGKWLLHGIETYRTPKAMIGKQGAHGPVPERLIPLFKDREEEAAGASIGQAVESALATSEFLIVICSPRSAQSQWVNHEIAWFKTHRDPGNILALIVDGEPGGGDRECFPKALTHRVNPDLTITDIAVDAPLAADARISGDGKRKARLKLAAAMLGVGLDELVNRDERRRTLRTRIVVGASLALATVMSGLAWYAVQQRNEAQVQRGQAEGLVEYMIGDLRKKLQPKVQIEVLGSIAKRAQAFYAVQSKYGMDDDALGRRSRMLKLLADIETEQGNSDVAFGLLSQSVAASGELLTRDPDNPDRILEQAFSLQGLGNILFQRGDLGGAEARMQEAVRLTTHLINDIGRKDEWLAEHGSALANLGITQLQQHRLDPAIRNLTSAVAIKREMLLHHPQDRQGEADLGATLAWAAEAASQNGDDIRAQALRQEEQALYRAILTRSPDDLLALASLTGSRIKQADALIRQGKAKEALDLARLAAADADRTMRFDPSNASVIEDAARAQAVLAEAALMNSDLAGARKAADSGQQLAARLVSMDSAITSWSGQLLGNLRLLQMRIAVRGAPNAAACQAALAPIVAESARLEKLSDANPSVIKLALVAARASMMRGDYAALSGRQNEAETAWRQALAIINRAAGAGSVPKDLASRQLFSLSAARRADASLFTQACRQ